VIFFFKIFFTWLSLSLIKIYLLQDGSKEMTYEMTKPQPFDIEKYLHVVQSFHGYAVMSGHL
jgi:hypothetical protein